ncbi:hypothetical protein SPB21_05795 [Leptothoe sp. ISB3NOV94-8A]
MSTTTVDLNLVVYATPEEIQADKASLETDNYTAKLENTAYALLNVIEALKDYLPDIEVYNGVYLPVTVASAALAELARVGETLSLASSSASSFITEIQESAESAASFDPGSTAATEAQTLLSNAQTIQTTLEESISSFNEDSGEIVESGNFIKSVPANIPKIKEVALLYISQPTKSPATNNDPLEVATATLKSAIQEQVTDVLSGLEAKVLEAAALAATAAAAYDNWDTLSDLFGIESAEGESPTDGESTDLALSEVDNWLVVQQQFGLSDLLVG